MSTQIIDNNRLKSSGIVIALFHVDHKDEKSCFFKETFSLAEISIDIAFGIPFLSLSNVEVNFKDWELR